MRDGWTSRKRILIAEDDPLTLKTLKLRLEHEGFEALPAKDGLEALQEVEQDSPIDLILLDILMPRLDGYEVCVRLKSQPETARIPIIVMTASDNPTVELSDWCIEKGIESWIRKPFRTEELIAEIHKVLKNQQTEGGLDG